jgi:hypothetical protein
MFLMERWRWWLMRLLWWLCCLALAYVLREIRGMNYLVLVVVGGVVVGGVVVGGVVVGGVVVGGVVVGGTVLPPPGGVVVGLIVVVGKDGVALHVLT